MDNTEVSKRIPAFLPKHINVKNIVFGKAEDVQTAAKVKVGTSIPIYYKHEDKLYYLDMELDKSRFPFGIDRKTLKKNSEGKFVTKDLDGKPKLSSRFDKDNKRHSKFRSKYEEIEEFVRQSAVNDNEKFFGSKTKKVSEKLVNKNWRSQIKLSKNPEYPDTFDATIREYKDKKVGTSICDGDNNNVSIKDVDDLVSQGGMKGYSGTCIYRLRDVYVNSEKKMNIRVSYDTIKLYRPEVRETTERKKSEYDFTDETDDEFVDFEDDKTVENKNEDKSSEDNDDTDEDDSDDSDDSDSDSD